MSSVGVSLRQHVILGHRHCNRDSILIYLSVSGSAVIRMRILVSESVASVKLRIQNSRGFVVERQRLVFKGRELVRDDKTVLDYGVEDGNLLHLVVRISDLQEINVRTVCGMVFEFKADRYRNVGYLKEVVTRMAKGVADLRGHQLLCAGVELKDWVMVADLFRDSDSVIYLLVRKLGRARFDHHFQFLNEWTDSPGSVERKFQLEPIVVNPKAQIFPIVQELVNSVLAGLEKGKPPIRSSEGSGGAYFMQNEDGSKYVAVFKPVDEEPMTINNPRGLLPSPDGEGLKRGTRAGEGALREVAAYILDHPVGGRRSYRSSDIGFSGVPPTAMVRCLHEGFNHPEGYECAAGNLKIGSLQMFVENDGTCEDVGPKFFPVQEVHKISVLDIRLANADRHAGNILVHRKGVEGQIVLVPIDHGYCLPENFEDCTFEWLYWPQAREHYSPETVEYIKSLDAEEDIALLKFYGWELSAECAQTLRISTMLLKKGVERGLTPFTIGNILCRETIMKKSMIEEIINEAKGTLLPGSSEIEFIESISEIMDCHLNKLTQ